MGVGDTLVYISKESRKKKKRKRKKLLNFLKAASERKDKLTYDHVVLFRLRLFMQDFGYV